MTQETDNKNENQENESKYDIPKIIMDYAMEVIPPPDSGEEEEVNSDEMLEMMNSAVFLCTSAWNHAILPPEAGEKILALMKMAHEESDNMEGWEGAQEILLEIAEEMGEKYPDAEGIITDHDLEIKENGDLGFGIEVLPLEEALEALRQND
ncbi:MAG: hypothetical protein KAH38_01085 [Candidatus Hydrogenedentes bacterium]|nr:hypothetical protein [Candidatus Hydrogenedentota bacterium]